jgi:NitT/TauT family transport system ATP-binding protein
MSCEIVLNNISKHFISPDDGKDLPILDNVSLCAKKSEIVSVLGPSGCGKSTLLNIIMGFEKTYMGAVEYNGLHGQDTITEKAMVFQTPALFPWLTVLENISYGLKRKRLGKSVVRSKCEKIIALVGLAGFENYYPHHLSGGMQHRAALARVLVLDPQVLLMDEPFAALDAQTRLTMQLLLLNIWFELKMTIIFVTHDIEESLFLSDRVFVLSKRPGKISNDFYVPFKRPRDFEMTGSYEFSKLKKDILGVIFNPTGSEILRCSCLCEEGE